MPLWHSSQMHAPRALQIDCTKRAPIPQLCTADLTFLGHHASTPSHHSERQKAAWRSCLRRTRQRLSTSKRTPRRGGREGDANHPCNGLLNRPPHLLPPAPLLRRVALNRDAHVDYLLAGLKGLSSGLQVRSVRSTLPFLRLSSTSNLPTNQPTNHRQVLDASRPWLIYWITHSLDLLGIDLEPEEQFRWGCEGWRGLDFAHQW